MSFLILKWLHVLGATVLFGTGAGIAFFLVRAHRTGKADQIAAVAADVVRADLWFTTTAVVFQPLTGYLLMAQRGWSADHASAGRCCCMFWSAAAGCRWCGCN